MMDSGHTARISWCLPFYKHFKWWLLANDSHQCVDIKVDVWYGISHAIRLMHVRRIVTNEEVTARIYAGIYDALWWIRLWNHKRFRLNEFYGYAVMLRERYYGDDLLLRRCVTNLFEEKFMPGSSNRNLDIRESIKSDQLLRWHIRRALKHLNDSNIVADVLGTVSFSQTIKSDICWARSKICMSTKVANALRDQSESLSRHHCDIFSATASRLDLINLPIILASTVGCRTTSEVARVVTAENFTKCPEINRVYAL